jgi:hypothetical protein
VRLEVRPTTGLGGKPPSAITSREIPRDSQPKNGWSPLKTAFQAATKLGDGLPR